MNLLHQKSQRLFDNALSTTPLRSWTEPLIYNSTQFLRWFPRTFPREVFLYTYIHDLTTRFHPFPQVCTISEAWGSTFLRMYFRMRPGSRLWVREQMLMVRFCRSTLHLSYPARQINKKTHVNSRQRSALGKSSGAHKIDFLCRQWSQKEYTGHRGGMFKQDSVVPTRTKDAQSG